MHWKLHILALNLFLSLPNVIASAEFPCNLYLQLSAFRSIEQFHEAVARQSPTEALSFLLQQDGKTDGRTHYASDFLLELLQIAKQHDFRESANFYALIPRVILISTDVEVVARYFSVAADFRLIVPMNNKKTVNVEALRRFLCGLLEKASIPSEYTLPDPDDVRSLVIKYVLLLRRIQKTLRKSSTVLPSAYLDRLKSCILAILLKAQTFFVISGQFELQHQFETLSETIRTERFGSRL